MGVVYRARDTRLDRQVAIKLLRSDDDDDRARERLRFEAIAAAALDHPYICKIYEIGEHEDLVFLVMEYVTGETLDHRLRDKRIPVPEALRIGAEIAEALDEAHARGILHRDLKPANIMLTGQGHVKIMDFGLAKRLPPADGDSVDDTIVRLTTPGTTVGTPGYMSPEQVKGETLDARSDIFSFGVILSQMVSGQHPFRRPSLGETLSAVLRDPPEMGTDVPSQVASFLRRMLEKDADMRPPTASAVRKELERLASSPAPPVETAAVESRPAWVRPVLIAVVVAILLTFATVLAPRLAKKNETPPSPEAATEATVIRSIAVLPLDNYSGDPSQDYFAEGMTDELTTDLAIISELRVISRGSVMQFKGANRPPTPEIAKMLDVDAVVEGSVLRSGDKVRITAQLIDARADRHLWAKSFERSSRDVLALQDELAAAIANEIHVRLTPDERSRLTRTRDVNPEAYDAYLKGRYFFNRPSDENLKKAIVKFEESVALDPNYAPAYSGLSDAYLWAGYNEGVFTAAEAKPKAKAAAERAIELDDSSAEAHTSLAVFKLFYEYDWEGSEAEFRRAFELNPNYAFAHDQFGLGLAFQGRLDEAITEGKRAAELDPLSPQIPIDNAIALMFKGDFDAARGLARRAAELDPTFFFPELVNGWAALEQKRFEEAIPALEKAKSMESPAFVTAFLGYAYGMSGDRERAMAQLAELEKTSLRGEVLPFNLALIHLGLGDHTRAVSMLERAYASDSQWLGWLKEDRIFDPLRGEPRFQALMKRLGFEE